MTESAQLWYYKYEMNNGEPSWRDFVRLVQERFGPTMTDTPLGSLALLRRAGNVVDYSNKFMHLACREAELSELQQVHLFVAGLQEPVKTDVGLRSPKTLDDAIMYARAYEQRQSARPLWRPSPRTTMQTSASTTTTEHATTPGSGGSLPPRGPIRRRLTPSEMDQRKKVRHWRPYLWGREFMVRTDHYSLKFLLDQRLATIPQHQWASKLLGFDFRVEYKPGAQNVVADALSRRDADGEGELAALSAPSFQLFSELRDAVAADASLAEQRSKADQAADGWSWVDGLLLRHGKIYVPASLDLADTLIAQAHGAGHEGTQKTLLRLRADFAVDRDRVRVRDFVRRCEVCQRNKTEHLRPSGLLQPLPVPSTVWADIAMDFVEGVPRVNGKSVILTVVDRFSKYAHFMPLAHPYTATSVARVFFDEVVRFHGLPASVVSDRDPVFTSSFWRELFRLSGVQLQYSTAFHPQSDGQSEATNKIIMMYLRCLTGDRPRQWLRWLPWAEYCYNSSYQASIKTSPFRVVYGRDPPTIAAYGPGDSKLPAVEQQMLERDEFLAEIKDRLEQAQQQAKSQYDKTHRHVEFQVGDWVLLRLLHRPTASLNDTRGRGKLGQRYFGPYRVLERIGPTC